MEVGVVNTQFNIPIHEHSCEHCVLAYPTVYSYQEINYFPRQVFLDAFIKYLQKVTTSLFIPVCKFILPHGQCKSQMCHEISHLGFLLKSFWHIPILAKNINNRHFFWQPTYVYNTVPWSFFIMGNVLLVRYELRAEETVHYIDYIHSNLQTPSLVSVSNSHTTKYAPIIKIKHEPW